MKRAWLAIGLALVLVLFAFRNDGYSAGECENTPSGTVCVTLVTNDVVVTLDGDEIARVPAPVKTVTVKVPVPGPTVVVPSPVPGPVRTIVVTSPGPVRVVPTPVPGPVVVKLTPTPVGATVSPQPSPVVTVTPKPVPVPKFIDRIIKVSVPEAFAISALLVLLGILLALGILYYSYRTGVKDGEKFTAEQGREFLHELFRKD